MIKKKVITISNYKSVQFYLFFLCKLYLTMCAQPIADFLILFPKIRSVWRFSLQSSRSHIWFWVFNQSILSFSRLKVGPLLGIKICSHNLMFFLNRTALSTFRFYSIEIEYEKTWIIHLVSIHYTFYCT